MRTDAQQGGKLAVSGLRSTGRKKRLESVFYATVHLLSRRANWMLSQFCERPADPEFWRSSQHKRVSHYPILRNFPQADLSLLTQIRFASDLLDVVRLFTRAFLDKFLFADNPRTSLFCRDRGVARY
jgi:hypothetical protein